MLEVVTKRMLSIVEFPDIRRSTSSMTACSTDSRDAMHPPRPYHPRYAYQHSSTDWNSLRPASPHGLHARSLVDPDLQRQLRSVAELAHGRIPDSRDVPLDRLVRQLEGKGRDKHGQNDLCTRGEVRRNRGSSASRNSLISISENLKPLCEMVRNCVRCQSPRRPRSLWCSHACPPTSDECHPARYQK